MKINLSFQDNKSYLTAVCNGEWDTASAVQIVKLIKERARQTGHNRILIDWQGVSTPRSEFARYKGGVEVARSLGHPHF